MQRQTQCGYLVTATVMCACMTCVALGASVMVFGPAFTVSTHTISCQSSAAMSGSSFHGLKTTVVFEFCFSIVMVCLARASWIAHVAVVLGYTRSVKPVSTSGACAAGFTRKLSVLSM